MSADNAAPTALNPIAFSIKEAIAATGGAISRTRLFDLLNNGEIDARRIGRRTVIMADSLRAFLDRAPSARPGRPGAANAKTAGSNSETASIQ